MTLPLTVDDVLTTTRAVRRRLDLTRPVELSVVAECLELAVQAPTGGNRQDWRWLVIADNRRRSDVADVYRRAVVPGFEAALAATTDPAVRRAYQGAIHLAEVLHRVPVLVLPCLQHRITDPTHHQAAGFFGSILPAVWSFQLALRSRGLGSTLTTAHLRAESDMAAVLGIPDDVAQIALLPVAYTWGTDFRRAARPAVGDVARLDGWDGVWPT